MSETIQIRPAANREECRLVLNWLKQDRALSQATGYDVQLNAAADSPLLDPGQFVIAAAGPHRGQMSPVGGLIVIFQADRSVTLWPPAVAPEIRDAPSVQDALIAGALRLAEQQHCLFAQAILPHNDTTYGPLLARNQLPAIGTLLLMLRPPIGPAQTEPSPPGASHANYCTVDDKYSSDRFIRLLERTYEQSADFPELIGRKTGADSLATHQMQGEFDPNYWYFLQVDTIDAGLVMFTRHPDTAQWELIYLGLIPEFRGQGIARYSIARLLSNEEMGRAEIFLGVDSRNHSAVRLYRSLGFAAVDRQHVHFCWLPRTGS